MRKDTRLAGLQAALRAVKRNEHSGRAVGWITFDLRGLIAAEKKAKKGCGCGIHPDEDVGVTCLKHTPKPWKLKKGAK